ncbi:MAG: response regulator [Geminicoccaceae bacterium]|nr:response regulator [Geminicoccaceae bacterium]
MDQTPSGHGRHILVVDDDHRLQRLLQRFLSAHEYHVVTASDASEARRALENFSVDLMVLDVMMPGEDGVSLTGALRANSDLPILLLTARGEIEDRVSGLAAGADDYLVKPFDPRELLLRIATILRRTERAPEPAGPVRFGPFVFDPAKGELRRADQPVHLTETELALLGALASEPGLALSRQKLAELGRMAASDRAVDVQIVRLRRKIEDDPKQPRYLLTRRGEGYVLRTGD